MSRSEFERDRDFAWDTAKNAAISNLLRDAFHFVFGASPGGWLGYFGSGLRIVASVPVTVITSLFNSTESIVSEADERRMMAERDFEDQRHAVLQNYENVIIDYELPDGEPNDEFGNDRQCETERDLGEDAHLKPGSLASYAEWFESADALYLQNGDCETHPSDWSGEQVLIDGELMAESLDMDGLAGLWIDGTFEELLIESAYGEPATPFADEVSLETDQITEDHAG